MATYKIKDIEILTGIKAHTLRIWEKRYQILQPDRTDTQIRTYTDEELVLLLNISLLNKNGIKISRIAEMSAKEIAQKVKEVSSTHSNDQHIDLLILALVKMDEELFRKTLSELTDLHGITRMYQQYVIPFLERIGIMWLVGSINPAQEHFMSNLIRQKIIAEIEALPNPLPSENKAILFLPEHEWHELGLLLYHFHLRQLGIQTYYLGQSLPYDGLIESIQHIRPKWILTSWLTSVDEKYVKHYFDRLLKDAGNAKVLAGGYQIKLNEKIIPKEVCLFQNMEELTAHFQN